MEETISLQEIFAIIKNKMSLILSTFFIVLGLTALATFFLMKPTYSSSTQLIAKLPTSAEGQSNVNDVNFNLQMINTYKDVISSDVVLSDVQASLEKNDGFEGTVSDIRSMLSVEQNANSQMFSIKATARDPKLAQAVANAVSEEFKEQAIDLLSIDKITIMSAAELKTTPVSPNRKLNILIGSVLGLMLGVGLAFLVELLDKTVKDDKYIVETIEIPILGVVPQMTQDELDAKFTVTPTYNPARKATENTEPTRRQRSRV